MAFQLPSLESLRVFEACARLGSFARAGEDLGISPTAVGSKIRTLEAELGVPLFERSRSKLKLTASGKKLAGDVGAAFAALKTAVERVRGTTNRSLRISVTPAVASRWLAPRLARWDRWSNTVPVELDVGVPSQAIGTGHIDLAIRAGRGHWPGMAASLLMPIELTPMLTPALYQALGAPTSPAQLKDAPLLPSDMWPRWFRETGVEILPGKTARTIYPTQDVQAEAALSGAGVALLSPTLFRSLLKSAQLIAPFPHVLSGPDGYYAVYPPVHRSAAVTAFLQWLQSEVVNAE